MARMVRWWEISSKKTSTDQSIWEIGPNGNLFVLSLGSGDVFEFDGFTGEPLGLFAELPVSPTNDLPLAMRFGPNGNLYIAVFSTPRVVEFDGVTGTHIGDFGDTINNLGPAGLDFGPNGNLFVTDAVTGSIEEYDGTTGSYVGQFFIGLPPGQFAIVPIEFGPDGLLYLCHNVAGAVATLDAVTGELVAVLENGPLIQPIGLTLRPASSDCNVDSQPDECEDCNGNRIADECDIAQGTSQDINANDIPDECEGVDIEVAITLLHTQSDTDSSTSVPVAATAFEKGQTFVAEIWATDRGVINTGLLDVYVDVAFDSTVVSAEGIQHRTPFLGNTMGSIDNNAGLIATLGGSDILGGDVGIEPEWRRIAIVEFLVLECPFAASFDLSSAALPIVANGRGAIDPAEYFFGSCDCRLRLPVCLRFRRYRSNQRGRPGNIRRLLADRAWPSPGTNAIAILIAQDLSRQATLVGLLPVGWTIAMRSARATSHHVDVAVPATRLVTIRRKVYGLVGCLIIAPTRRERPK